MKTIYSLLGSAQVIHKKKKINKNTDVIFIKDDAYTTVKRVSMLYKHLTDNLFVCCQQSLNPIRSICVWKLDTLTEKKSMRAERVQKHRQDARLSVILGMRKWRIRVSNCGLFPILEIIHNTNTSRSATLHK